MPKMSFVDEMFSRPPPHIGNNSTPLHLPDGTEENEYNTGSLSSPPPCEVSEGNAYDVGTTSPHNESRTGSFEQRRPPLPPPDIKSYRGEL